MKKIKLKQQVPPQIIEDYKECKECGCDEVKFDHISNLDKYTKRLAREVLKRPDCYVSFCPICEVLGFITKGA